MREERAHEILRSLMLGAESLDMEAGRAEHDKACEIGAAAVALIAAQERHRITSERLDKARTRGDRKYATDAFLNDQCALLDENDARKAYNDARLNPMSNDPTGHPDDECVCGHPWADHDLQLGSGLEKCSRILDEGGGCSCRAYAVAKPEGRQTTILGNPATVYPAARRDESLP